MTIWVNGQPREVSEGMTLAALLTSMEVGGPGVAVEVNAEVVRRARHAEFQLSPRDRVEIVTFVGGG
ncbi:MAG TPA: sulfur carrier protein ThiS [Archangium sp.]|uniref:sulfur carrier protein ThiS n=1 Tax=Archangium sp. TaxID=1872627 RepID=UPI002ED869E1